MCNIAWHPVWRVIAKDARVRQPGVVLAVFHAVEGEGTAATRLTPTIIAGGLGFRVDQVERIMASLASHSVTCDGVVTQHWRQVGEPMPTLSQKPSAIRMRAKRLRDRETVVPTDNMQASSTVTCDAPFLEEEREQDSLFPSDAREVAEPEIRPAVGWGVQAEADKQAKRAKWLANTLAFAEPNMSFENYKRLSIAAFTDPLPRWAQAELDEWSRRRASAKGNGSPSTADLDRRQGHMPLPISGGGLVHSRRRGAEERRTA